MELREDLVGSCVVGDVITVLGLVKVLATGDPKPAGVRRAWRMLQSMDDTPLCLHPAPKVQTMQLMKHIGGPTTREMGSNSRCRLWVVLQSS